MMTEQRKPFSIETYSPEKRYETRDGRPARVLCVDNTGWSGWPVIALVSGAPYAYRANGVFYEDGESAIDDLFESASQPSPQPDDWAAKAQADRDAEERKRRRDMFAAAALTGLLANPQRDGFDRTNLIVEDARSYANAMIAALDWKSK